MAKISSIYPNRFLKPYELSKQKRTPALIERVTTEVFGNDFAEKLVVTLLSEDGSKRELVLNQTNARRLAAEFGDETDHWHGREVVLWTADINFRGDIIASVQIEPAPSPVPEAPKTTPKTTPKMLGRGDQDLDDEIPF